MVFWPGRSTFDHIFIVKQSLEKCWEYNVSVYLTYIDFRQAYDSVRRQKIYEALQHFQISNKLLRLVKVTVDSWTVQ